MIIRLNIMIKNTNSDCALDYIFNSIKKKLSIRPVYPAR